MRIGAHLGTRSPRPRPSPSEVAEEQTLWAPLLVPFRQSRLSRLYNMGAECLCFLAWILTKTLVIMYCPAWTAAGQLGCAFCMQACSIDQAAAGCFQAHQAKEVLITKAMGLHC